MTSAESTPFVSVCIANYNGEAIITDCIQSVLDQKDAPEFEILVHDDASTDSSLSVIAQFDAVQLIKSSENVGFCISNNRMAAAARGKFILLLNNDARLFPDALTTLVEESRKHADNVVLGLPQYDYATRELVDFGLKLDYFASSVPIKRPSEDEVAMVIGACMWVPRVFWQRVGGFPEWFETNAEDVYLCCYARLLGYNIYVPARSGFLHMIGHSLGGGKSEDQKLTISVRRRYFSERNRLFVQWLFYPGWLIPFTTAANLVVLTLEAIVLSIVNRKASLVRDIYFRSQVDAFSSIGAVRNVRRIVMRSRKLPYSRFLSAFTVIPQKLRLLFSSGLPKA
ncbi:MAG: glycosyltransferase [Woeseiaceae bacterium]